MCQKSGKIVAKFYQPNYLLFIISMLLVYCFLSKFHVIFVSPRLRQLWNGILRAISLDEAPSEAKKQRPSAFFHLVTQGGVDARVGVAEQVDPP